MLLKSGYTVEKRQTPVAVSLALAQPMDGSRNSIIATQNFLSQAA